MLYIDKIRRESKFPEDFRASPCFRIQKRRSRCARNQTYSSYFIHTDVACNCVRMVSMSDLSTLPYRQVFPWRWACRAHAIYRFLRNLQAREEAVWRKSIRVPSCRANGPGVNVGGPLIGVSPQMRMGRWCWTSHMPSPGHITNTSMILTPSRTRINGLLSEWVAASIWWIFTID